jgi:Arc/MetJ family transcription regulator
MGKRARFLPPPGAFFQVEQTTPVDIVFEVKEISIGDKTSLAIDREKLERARKALGTKTIAATVDAALDEAIRLAARRRLMERIRRQGGLGPSPAEVRRLRRRRH